MSETMKEKKTKGEVCSARCCGDCKGLSYALRLAGCPALLGSRGRRLEEDCILLESLRHWSTSHSFLDDEVYGT